MRAERDNTVVRFSEFAGHVEGITMPNWVDVQMRIDGGSRYGRGAWSVALFSLIIPEIVRAVNAAGGGGRTETGVPVARFFGGVITLDQCGPDWFIVQYLDQVTTGLSYAEAAEELGRCILHHLAGESRIDNSVAGSSNEWGYDTPRD